MLFQDQTPHFQKSVSLLLSKKVFIVKPQFQDFIGFEPTTFYLWLIKIDENKLLLFKNKIIFLGDLNAFTFITKIFFSWKKNWKNLLANIRA